MTTEALSLPPPATGERHRGTLLEGQEGSDAFQVENGDMAQNVALTTSPEDSWVPPLDGALISFDDDSVLGPPSTSVQKEGPLKESSLPPLSSSETFKMDDDGLGQNGGHFVLQGKIPDTSLEQLKATETSSLSAQGEDGSHFAFQGQTPDAFAEEPNPAGNSEWMTGGEEERPHNRQDTHPTSTADSLEWLELLDTSSKLDQEGKGSPRAHDRDTSEVRLEQQESSQLGAEEESQEMGHHGKTPGVGPEFPAQPEASRGPKEAACGVENHQEDCLLSKSPNLLQQGLDSPSQVWEETCPLFPGHDPSGAASAEPQRTFDAASTEEGLKTDGQDMTETGEGERVTGGQENLPVALGKDPGVLKGQLLDETLLGNSQGREEPVAQDRERKAGDTFQALALTDPLSSVGTCCQQRAAGRACDDTFPQAVPPLSLVATGDSLGPAHGGLAPGQDEGGGEVLSAPESRAAGGKNNPLGEAGARPVLESEKGEEAAGGVGPDSTAREPAGAEALAREAPSLESGTGASPEDPSNAMVLACAEEPLGARRKRDSQDLSSIQYLMTTSEQADSQAKPRGDLRFDSKEPADTGDPVNVPDPISDEFSGAGGPPTDKMENDTGNPENCCPSAETPIEREIRLHLEREDLLRQQRGLASSRGTQEYVEVRIRPILSQSVPPSPLAKEKELQWAGAQMQREIQRECQREEALVQLGKVRGAYDRGTPQELQEKKMIFEQQAPPDPLGPTKAAPGSSEGTREQPAVEATGATGRAATASGALLQPLPERPSTANPFFCLRAQSPQSLLEREVQEAQERERELQRQRRKIYGSALPRPLEEASDQEEEVPFQPERPPCKKLDVTWPPPSPSESCQVNGLHQLERSPRSRQKIALIQRWESGTFGNQESQD